MLTLVCKRFARRFAYARIDGNIGALPWIHSRKSNSLEPQRAVEYNRDKGVFA
jgi:hypothetical protein